MAQPSRVIPGLWLDENAPDPLRYTAFNIGNVALRPGFAFLLCSTIFLRSEFSVFCENTIFFPPEADPFGFFFDP